MAELKGKVESNELAIKVNIVGSGPRGANGKDGKDGKDGYTPIKGIDYFDGLNGRDGADGRTPVRGEDYFTDTDIAETAAEAAQLVPRYDDTELREMVDTKADKTALDETNRSLDFLWKLNQGVTWDIEQREESGHAQLPKGGVYGNADEVRGLTTQDGEPTPDNPVEIVSVEEIRIKKIGKNLFDKDVELSRMYLNSSGGFTDGGAYAYRNHRITAYTGRLVISGRTSNVRIGSFDKNDNLLSRAVNPITFDVPQDAAYLWFSVDDTTAKSLQIEYGSTATEYEPFIGTIAERTIIPPKPLNAIGNGEYKDKLNVVTGEWEYNFKTLKFGVLSWASSDPDRHIYRTSNMNTFDVDPPPTNEQLAVAVCDHFLPVGYGPISAQDNGKYAITAAFSTRIVVIDHRFNTLDDFKVGTADVNLLYKTVFTETLPIDSSDLDYLRNLTLNKGENLFITDNHGRDVSYLMSDFINLKEALA